MSCTAFQGRIDTIDLYQAVNVYFYLLQLID